jgi:hypothetical protein
MVATDKRSKPVISGGRSVGATRALTKASLVSRTVSNGHELPSDIPLYHWAILENPWCRRRDLNPHDPKITSPSSWRVCLFRHFDADFYFSPRSILLVE